MASQLPPLYSLSANARSGGSYRPACRGASRSTRLVRTGPAPAVAGRGPLFEARSSAHGLSNQQPAAQPHHRPHPYAGFKPGLPASVTNDAAVAIGAPGVVTAFTVLKSARARAAVRDTVTYPRRPL